MTSTTTRGFLLAVFALACLVFLPGLGTRELWSPDEPRFALIAEDMLREGDFVVPHLLGRVYAEKPPLQVWLVVLAALPFGHVTEWAARFPSAVAAIATVLLTGWFARRYFGEGAGFASALVLMTSGHFFMRGRWSCTDTLLTFFFLGAVVLAFLWTEGKRWAGWGFILACALATLTKGPVGLVLPAGILVAHLALEGRGREIPRFPWISGGLLFAAVVLPWFLLYGLRVGGGELSALVLRENVDRFFHAWNNVRPFHYYLGRFPVSFLPWSVFLPVAAVAFFRARRDPALSPLRFVVLWFLLVFVFFSISSGKRTVYLLPIFPAASIVLGWFFERGLVLVGGARSRWVLASTLALHAVLALAAVAAPIAVLRIHPEALHPTLGAAAILVLGSVTAMGFAWKGNLRRAILWTSGALVAAGLVTVLCIGPAFDSLQNVRNLAPMVVRIVAPGARFAAARDKREAFLFYTGLRGEEIATDDDLRRILGGDAPAYCLVAESDWNRVAGGTDVPGEAVLRGTVSTVEFVLVSNEVRHAR